MLRKKYHDKPASLAESGRKPSTLVKFSLETFELSFSSFKDDFLLRAAAGFLALCISLHLEPLEHLPVVENSSHSRMCFLLHCQTKTSNNVLTVNNHTANDTKETRNSKQRIISGKSGHLSTLDNKCTPAQGKMSTLAIWLATRVGKIAPSCPLGITCCASQEYGVLFPYNKFVID